MPITNPQLAKAEASIESKIQPKDKASHQKIVIAGLKVLFSKELNGELFNNLRQSKNPAISTAEGIIGLLGILYKQSRNTMPVGPMVTAGMTLILNSLDFAEQAGIIKVDNEMIDLATEHYLESLLPKIGVTPEQLQQVLGKLGQMSQDPSIMEKLKQGNAA